MPIWRAWRQEIALNVATARHSGELGGAHHGGGLRRGDPVAQSAGAKRYVSTSLHSHFLLLLGPQAFGHTGAHCKKYVRPEGEDCDPGSASAAMNWCLPWDEG